MESQVAPAQRCSKIWSSYSFAKYFNQTPYGQAGIHWRKEDHRFFMDLTIPVGSEATVFVPANNPGQVMEGNSPAAEAEGLNFLRMENEYAVFYAGSGTYEFVSTFD